MSLPHYSFDDLVQSLEGRRRLGEDPPVLLLGAGASAAAGLATMRRLYEADGIAADAADAFELFCERMRRRDERERFRWLAGLLQTADPAEVSPGYQALARLCAEHVFDVVLSANLDPLLEDAFSATALKRRDVLLLVNGVLRTERLPLLLLRGAPRVKLLKIHGDLFHRTMAWTPEEMKAYLQDITPALTGALTGRDVLVVGYSMRDPAVRELALGTGGTVWFAGPNEPPPDVTAALEARSVRLVIEPRCLFEDFFTGLASALGVAPPPASSVPPALAAAAPPPLTGAPRRAAKARPTPAPETADNLDEVLAATVGIAVRPGGYIGFTGFVLAEPRVIVTDGWNLAPIGRSGQVEVVTQTGRRLPCKVLGQIGGHAFGPALLQVPPELSMAGLRLAGAPAPRGAAVHAAVGTSVRRAVLEGAMSPADAVAQGLLDADTAAQLQRQLAAGAPATEWQHFSLSKGEIADARPASVNIAPIGFVADLTALKLATAPGSSGAPVVDAEFAVQGFVVAGSLDPKRPESYMLGSAQWAAPLRQFMRRKR